jgi:glucose/arabinose dehydrogenase
MFRQSTSTVISILIASIFLTACGGGMNQSQPVPMPAVQPPPTPVPTPTPQPPPTPVPPPTLSVTAPNAFPSLPGLVNPVGLYQAPGDDTRWFVIEQAGRVRVFANRSDVSTLDDFVDIRSRVASGGELGLLGMAFHPNFASNRRVFLSYTAGGAPRVSRISQFTAMADLAHLDPNSEVILLTLNQPEDNHNGGNIVFGPDGFLYIGFGDGGGAGDNHPPIGNGQSLTTMLGKILRIDVNGAAPYAIPADNPYFGNPRCGPTGGSQNCPEIYAYGFRNPWRFSFDRTTGELWAADVGQNMWEEVDLVTKGGNYGWRCREGAHDYLPTTCGGATNLIDPVAEYDHSVGISITGGFAYRGTQVAQLNGRYIFGDFGSGRIWAWIPPGNSPRQPTQLGTTTLSISSFAEAQNAELYLVNYGSGSNGTVHRLVFQSQ